MKTKLKAWLSFLWVALMITVFYGFLFGLVAIATFINLAFGIIVGTLLSLLCMALFIYLLSK